MRDLKKEVRQLQRKGSKRVDEARSELEEAREDLAR